MMIADEFYLDEVKLPLVERYLDRIEQLFHVNLTLVENEGHSSESRNVARVFVSSENMSQDGVEEAKRYISSLLKEDDDKGEQCHVKYDFKFVKMVQEKRDEIEKQTQAVIKVDTENNEICIFGPSKCVLDAKDMIERIVSLENYSEEVKTRGGFSDGKQNNEEICRDFVDGTECQILESNSDGGDNIGTDNDTSLQIDGAPIDTGTSQNISSNFILSTLNSKGGKMQPCVNPLLNRENSVICDSDLAESSSLVCDKEVQKLNKCLSSQSSCSSTSTEESEHEQPVKQVHDRTKVEFALKLGYSEVQLTAVLKKLGPDAGKNEILSELISLVSEDNSDTDSDDNSDSLKFGQELSDLEKVIKEKEGGDSKLRPIVIDGSNVAMSHGNKEIFSCKGIKIAVDWFLDRGHDVITVFVPQWRKETSRPDAKITDQDVLLQLEKEKVVVFTPARRIGGKRVVCYDDRYILNLAVETGGIVVSNDNYRDLVNEKSEYRKVIEERLLMYSFVNDRFMPPDDPLGRYGPSLENFLSREPKQPDPLPPLCPYGSKKCTYGNKCKFYHPERGNNPHRTVTEKLAEQTKQKLQEIRDREKAEKKKQPLTRNPSGPKMALQRTRSLVPYSNLPSSLIDDTPSYLRKSASDLTQEFDRKAEIREIEKEKLQEYKKCLEQAEINEKKKQETQRRKNDEESKCLRKHSNEYLIEGHGSRSSSPKQRKSPSPKPKLQQEQFLISGHLMLAKKLSDEASESKYVGEECGSTKRTAHVRSPLTIYHPPPQQTNDQGTVTTHPSLSTSANVRQHRPLSMQKSSPLPSDYQPQTRAPNRHKQLSRQYSLQGSHDPRLSAQKQKQARGPSEPQNMAYYVQQQQMMQTQYGQNGQNMAQQPGYPISSYQMPQGNDGRTMSQAVGLQDMRHHALAQHENLLHNRQYLGLPEFGEHSSLARMQSAPEVVQYRQREQHNKKGGRMMRQNSSSDTQLHMIGDIDQTQVDYCLFPGGSEQFPLSQGSHSGNVTYNRDLTERHDVFHNPSQEASWISKHASKEGIDAFESDYPSSELRSRGQDPWTNRQNQFYSPQAKQHVRQQNFIPSNEDHFRPMIQSQQPNIRPKRPLTKTESTGFKVHQPVEHASLSVPSFGTVEQGYGNIGVIGQEQKSNPRIDSSYNFGQYQMGSNMGNQAHASVSHLDSGSGASATADDAPIHPTDKRYNLYYHLCGLFAEHKVRAVMNQHPEETNPQELCAYIIGAK
ncbi:hypothetical protein FSP39_023298 [Pinctada imbricata]|uniref:C3H1-type domain-containing protein n=1 Tax=Pinctada imbricata TaxID=66713 RepID=A0AA88Y5W2_PINIB|nr:hypothetical protein FSP39_023298 [Pinctada imbricata]